MQNAKPGMLPGIGTEKKPPKGMSELRLRGSVRSRQLLMDFPALTAGEMAPF